MNILFSSDDNYARHLGVAVFSLMIHNQKAKKLNFFVVDNQISEDNLSKLKQVVEEFSNSTLTFIPFESYARELELDMPWPISMSAYARLFAAEVLAQDIDRVLYMDCDMVVCRDLSNLWNTDLQGKCLAAVQDQVFPFVKSSVGLSFDTPYFNSGLLLIDLNKWRSLNIRKKCLLFIKQKHGKVIHHDQGVLNGVLQSEWIRLPLAYNVMTIHFFFSQRKTRKYFNDHAPFYDEAEILAAKSNPAILHFTPSFTTHPWERNCQHFYRNLYREIQFQTPWAEFPIEKSSQPWYVKLVNWRYRVLPY